MAYQLSYDVYIKELGRNDPADHAGCRMPDAAGRAPRLLLAEHDGKAIGTMRLDWGGDGPFSPDERAIYRVDVLEQVVTSNQIHVFSRVATYSSYRGGDTPGQLIDAMVRFAIAHDVCVVLCDCRPPLINTYLRLGFRVFGPVVNAPAVGILVPLILLLDDRAHIEAAGSRIHPLLHGLATYPDRRDRLLALLPQEPTVETLERPQEALQWTRMVQVLAETSPEHFPIFRGLSVEDIARLTTMSNVVACGAGDLIVRQGTVDGMVFVVLEGAVDVMRDAQPVARLLPGSVFGEVAFLAQVPRSADVVAACDSRLICLRPSTLGALIEREPRVAAPLLLNLSRILARRLAGGAPLEPSLPLR